MAIQHPLQSLELSNGDIFIRTASGKEPYMRSRNIRIIEKLHVLQHPKDNTATYYFKLSDVADDIWEELLQRQLRHVPSGTSLDDLKVTFDGRTSLGLNCLPINLENKYAHLKASVMRTNADYETVRESAKREIAKFIQDREAGIRAKAERDALVKRGFDDLTL